MSVNPILNQISIPYSVAEEAWNLHAMASKADKGRPSQQNCYVDINGAKERKLITHFAHKSHMISQIQSLQIALIGRIPSAAISRGVWWDISYESNKNFLTIQFPWRDRF